MFPKLFSPARIGNLELKNRLVMAPCLTCFAENGNTSARQIEYYAARARGEVGLVTIEASYPSPGLPYPGRLCLNDDKYIPSLSRLAEAVHRAGTKVALQLNVSRGRADDIDPVSPSPNVHPFTGVQARAVSADDIARMIDAFGEGSRRARAAGFDAINIHGASGYLVTDFLSPLLNRRGDGYGGDTASRARFAIELVRAAKAGAGRDFPVIFRLCGDEHISGGLEIDEAIAICRFLEQAGVDAVDIVSGGTETYFQWVTPGMALPRGCNVHLAAAATKWLRIPVITTGRIVEPVMAEAIIEEGCANFIGVGRALIADPDFAIKARQGRLGDIRKCTGCLYCVDHLSRDKLTCAVNPHVDREAEPDNPAVEKAKRVLVVGGGPAGMQAAASAARRGHHVTLWEQGHELGGQLLYARVQLHKGDLFEVVPYLAQQAEKAGVQIALDQAATPELVLAYAPDALVLATGVVPAIPPIAGIERPNVVLAADVLGGRATVGKCVAVVGGGLVGLETAEFLAGAGKKVTVMRRGGTMGDGIGVFTRFNLLHRLSEAQVELLPGVQYLLIHHLGIVIATKEGKEELIEADTIVIAAGARPADYLAKALAGKVPEIHTIGDCVSPRRMADAIREGALVGEVI